MWEKIPGLQVSPVGVIQEPTKVRIIHDLSYQQESWGPSMNDQTELEDAPPVHCGTVIGDVIRRIVGLRKKFPGTRIMISKMDVKDAFRQVPVDPQGAAKFGYCLGDLLVIDFRLQFG
ncbi:unnamed protein product [Choristocarpus tenellus]